MRYSLLLALAAAFTASACSDDMEPIGCTAEARYSTRVTVLSDGASVDDASVEYSVDGGPPAPCTALGTLYVCGIEEAGAFLITASRGEQIGASQVEVTADDCHVSTEDVSVVLMR